MRSEVSSRYRGEGAAETTSFRDVSVLNANECLISAYQKPWHIAEAEGAPLL